MMLNLMLMRHKACFWYYVATYLQMSASLRADNRPRKLPKKYPQWKDCRCVHGFIGGRSGSTDLPAFVGVNTFSWEEPFLTVKCNKFNQSYERLQIYQMLRLLNEHPMMRIGYLDIKTRKERGDHFEYSAIYTRDKILVDWLTQMKYIPLLPKRVNEEAVCLFSPGTTMRRLTSANLSSV